MSKKALAKTVVTRFIPITRVEEIDDETCRVVGVATSDAVDSFDTVFDYDESKNAYGRWTGAFERMTGGESKGNIREMHQKSAVGKVVDWTPDDEKRQIELSTLVVGKEPVRKCRERIYTGFSHGVKLNSPGRTEKRDGKSVTVYRDFDVVEVSLVDAGSNPESVFTMVRRAQDGTTEVLTPMQAAAKSILDESTAGREQAINTVVDKVVESITTQAAAPTPAPAAPAAAAATPETPARAADSMAVALASETAKAFTQTFTEAVRNAQPTKESRRVPYALEFDAKKFTPEQGAAWAKAHEFRAATPPAASDKAVGYFFHQRPASLFTPDQKFARTQIADGIHLLTGTLKEDGVPALLERLRLAKPALVRYAQSESSSILPALSAMASICYAMDSEIYGMSCRCFTGCSCGCPGGMACKCMPGCPCGCNCGADPLAASQVASLTTACEAILEFIGSELQEQLSSLAGSTGEARAAVATALERFAALPKVLRPAQIERLMQEGELGKDAVAMHAAGHDLIEATITLASTCRCARCAPAAPGTLPATPEVQRTAAPAVPAPAAAIPPAAAAPATVPATKRIAEAPSPETTPPTVQVDASLTARLAVVEGELKAAKERLQQVEKSPTRIGRPPAAPVEKRMAGSPGAPIDARAVKAELERIADTTDNPSVRIEMRKRLAELELMHPAAP